MIRRALIVLSIAAVVVLLRRFVIDIVGTTGASMWPAVPASGTTLWVDRTAAWRGDLERFSLGVFDVDGNRIVKRVVGLGGDSVLIRAGDLWLGTRDGGFGRAVRPAEVLLAQRCPVVPGTRNPTPSGGVSPTPGGGWSWAAASGADARLRFLRHDGEDRILDDGWMRDAVPAVGANDVADVRIMVKGTNLGPSGRLRVVHAVGDDRLSVEILPDGIIVVRSGEGLDPAPVRFPGVPTGSVEIETLDGLAFLRIDDAATRTQLWSAPRDTTRGGPSRVDVFFEGEGRVDAIRMDRDVHYSAPSDAGPFTIPGDALFVLGDNPAASTDGRDFGPLPIRNLRGCVLRGR